MDSSIWNVDPGVADQPRLPLFQHSDPATGGDNGMMAQFPPEVKEKWRCAPPFKSIVSSLADPYIFFQTTQLRRSRCILETAALS